MRLVLDHEDEYPSQWAAIGSVAEKLSINRETLRLWVRGAETDEGRRPGLTTDEREISELRRANEMVLKSAAVFFGAELDRRQQR